MNYTFGFQFHSIGSRNSFKMSFGVLVSALLWNWIINFCKDRLTSAISISSPNLWAMENVTGVLVECAEYTKVFWLPCFCSLRLSVIGFLMNKLLVEFDDVEVESQSWSLQNDELRINDYFVGWLVVKYYFGMLCWVLVQLVKIMATDVSVPLELKKSFQTLFPWNGQNNFQVNKWFTTTYHYDPYSIL